MRVGGEVKYASHFFSVVWLSYLLDFFDQWSNSPRPSLLPRDAANTAMPTLFQLMPPSGVSQGASSLGMTASAAAISSIGPSRLGLGACLTGSPAALS